MPFAGGDGRDRLRVWCMTTGESGSRQQARGLARTISRVAEEHVVRVSRIAALAPPALFSMTLLGVRSVEGFIEPPWPHVLISCGRRSALAAMAVRRRAAQPMVLAHIQSPPDPRAFDLVVAMPHDRLEGSNVIMIETALHGIRAADLGAAAQAPDSRFAALPRPWTGVLLGGPTGRRHFSPDDARRLVDQLDALRAEEGGSLLITPSRRTPASALALLDARYAKDPSVFIWQGGIANPYLAILAQSDRLVVTSDSISMISEALATEAEVLIFNLPGGDRHEGFVRNLTERRLVVPLDRRSPKAGAKRTTLDATPGVATEVRRLIEAKFGRDLATEDHP